MKRTRLLSHKNQESDESLINLTPLIDVVFVVLIMFIIVAPMLELDHVQLATAAAQADKKMAVVQENSAVILHVHADNTIWLNNKRMSEKELLSQLKEARQQHPQHIPQLFHDKKAFFGTYQAVKNVVELAGFEEMDVILQPG